MMINNGLKTRLREEAKATLSPTKENTDAKNQEGDYPQEIRVPITALQYVQLRDEKADPKYKITRRKRFEFIIDSVTYSIDVYKNLYG